MWITKSTEAGDEIDKTKWVPKLRDPVKVSWNQKIPTWSFFTLLSCVDILIKTNEIFRKTSDKWAF